MSHLYHERDGLEPAETLFDSFALLLTGRVANMSRRPLIEGASAVATEVPGNRATRVDEVVGRMENEPAPTIT